ncbi:TRAP transporter permease [Marivita geojedonensis]|uniref:C4-dicarboxylate ABC transporter permease n=1 Tax=Marivita geojedonensis TaxID=1123756 RepID=A0A1X4NNH1_9RHOB|nr:TRAP transporter fused permease subunit [Marivita geojedonensis]OSQ51945.1 C4-dicarboxylate ABC transporter permease [Marivita geojedonensis]PRY81320.1 TRAP transporter 4TM/12TM fusion protein [Marivita geojedonensis]
MPALPARLAKPLADLLAACLVLLAVGWALSLQRQLGLDLYPQQFFAGVLFFALPLAFLTLPARRTPERGDVPLYDLALAALSMVAIAYIAVNYPDLVLMIFSRPPELWVTGLVVILLLMEALRRATGLALVLIIAAFLLYALFGDQFPGRLQGRPQNWQLLAGYLAVDSNGVLGLPMSVASTVVIAFILFGVLLGITGGSQFFTDAAMIGMGRFRGGSMKISVLASGLFGSISGSAVANVVGTGVVTIPMIKRDGYPAHKAGAIEAVASTGGQLMPPVMGASAFLMAEFLAIPYSQIVMAALLPAILYYVALFIQADLEAAKLGIQRVPEDQIPDRRTVLVGLHFVTAFAVLIYLLFWQRYQPERAALWAALALCITALIFGYRGLRPTLANLFGSLARTGRGVIEILLISAASGIVIGVLNITGLSFNLTYALVQVGGGSAVMLLALSAIVCIILGMGLPTLGVYVLLAALVAPALIEVGIEPIAAHLYVLYFGMMSMITPPIALAAFAAAAIAKAPAMATGWAAMRFGWAAYVIPVLFVFSPSLILIGETGEILFAAVTAGLGVWLVSAALAGYFVDRLTPLKRLLFIAAGLMALVPAGAFQGALLTDAAGVALGLLLIATELMRRRAPVAGEDSA